MFDWPRQARSLAAKPPASQSQGPLFESRAYKLAAAGVETADGSRLGLDSFGCVTYAENRNGVRELAGRDASNFAVQPRVIKHADIGFSVAPGGPAIAGRPPRACRRSRGWGRPGGTLGWPAVGDSGPLPGPDRRAPKQANISSLTRLYTALQSAPPRALRHRCSSGIWNADPTLT
jgi:hypothetical protein